MKFSVKQRKITLGSRKGQTGYFAQQVTTTKVDLETVVQNIVDETSLGYGDIRNAIVSMSHIVERYITMGQSVDLGELGTFRVIVPSKILDDPKDVTASNALKKPILQYIPKAGMREALAKVKLEVNNPYRKKEGSSTDEGDDEEPTTPVTPGGSGDGDGGME